MNRPPLFLKPQTPTVFHWLEARSQQRVQLQNASINSLWTDAVALSLGEQLREIRVPEGFGVPRVDERVLRVYMVQNQNQLFITLEFAVSESGARDE